MRTPAVRRVPGAELLRRGVEVADLYAEVFTASAWRGDSSAASFIARLSGDVARPGFVAALAFDEGEVVGFATGWTTPTPFPVDRCHPEAAAALGPERTWAWLSGAREIDEMAVAAPARWRGCGSALLEAVTADAPDGRCWLMTPVHAVGAVAFYHRLGWSQATHPAPEGAGHAVFLGPRHPARAAVHLPL
ncbi:GNAT family N-acetyltransferase [Streptomyces sp. NPDC052077]|uniref:GNAT family N-acetyltransferase n=1 Tax=Streptomyces sp. NPDC052077 TaxID=3154757 RepID=UPI003418B58D